MRIKRFEAKDSTTALALIKEEMGEDAVILSTRKLPQNLDPKTGKVSRALIEVVAAIDYDLDDIFVPPPQKEAPRFGSNPSSQGTYKRNAICETSSPSLSKQNSTPSSAPSQIGKNTISQKIHSEAQELRSRFSNRLRQPGKRPGSDGEQTQKSQASPKTRSSADPAEVAVWRDQLINNIMIQAPAPLISFGEPHMIALVGATGVGKTTTAAKLAAWYSLHQGKRVCLLSMDCYRIGATDQLRTYARIMRLPCEIVLRKNDLSKAIDRHRDKDVIIIDTAGKSPYDVGHIEELQDWFHPVAEILPHLVLSATTKKEDILSSLKVYKPLALSSLVLSKLDETRAYASLCQQVVSSNLPISYLCTGQRVPEDFFVASKEFLDRLFKNGWDAAVPHFNKIALRYS